MENATFGNPISIRVYGVFIIVLIALSWSVRACTVDANTTTEQLTSYDMEPLTPFRIGGGGEYVRAMRNDEDEMIYYMKLVVDDSTKVHEFSLTRVMIKEYDILVNHNPRLEVVDDSTYIAYVPQGTVSNRHYTPVNEPTR